MKHGKNYTDSRKLIDRLKQYELDEAVSLVKQTAKAKFDETICLAVRLGVDPRHADQQVRGAIVLPHGTGKTVRVLCFAKDPAKIKEAEEAGADIIGDDETITKIQGGWLEFDVAVATPDMMGQVGKVARILGPRGMMPNPKSGTVTQDIAKAINEIKAGKVEYRVDRNSIINVPLGKASFEDSALAEHITLLMEAIIKAKPSSAKGTYIKSATISSTMGPGIKINQHAFS